MQNEKRSETMNQYLLALADVERLQIVSQLIQASSSILELSTATGLPEKQVNHHLNFLLGLGLVECWQDQDVQYYVYKEKTMETLIKTQATQQKQPVATPWDGMPEESRRRLSNLLTSDGRLEYIPTQSKKLRPILEYVAGSFEKDREYSEKEVNSLLEMYTRDTSTLRRFLVELGFLSRTRDGARYWKK